MSLRFRTLARLAPVVTVAFSLAGVTGALPGAHAATGTAPTIQLAAALSPDGTADLDGDGRGDVVQTSNSAVGVRRGIDGQLLWSHPVSDARTVVAVRLGSPARPGVLVVSQRDDITKRTVNRVMVTTRDDRTLTLTAFDGATGGQLWKLTRTGTFHQIDGTSSQFPAYADVLPSWGPRASRMVLTSTTFPGTAPVQPEVVSGANGSVTDAGAGVKQRYVVGALGDVNGDGYADVGIANNPSGDGAGRLEARSSTNGTTLWTSSDTPDRPFVFHLIRDVNGDGRADILATRASDDEKATTDQVIDGHTGAGLVALPKAHTFPIGDITGDGRIDFGWYLFDTPPSVPNEYGLFAAYDGRTGNELWSQEYATDVDRALDMRPAGDVQPDGIADLYFQTNDSGNHHYVVNMRTGAFADGPAVGIPLQASVDGVGDDFASVVGIASGFTATAYDGRSRSVLWSVTQPTPTSAVGSVAAAQLTGDNRADVLMSTDDGHGHVTATAIDGATHAVLWSVTF
jgi:hypothetical protein